MLEAANLKERTGDIRSWYDGYVFGNTSVYCPWDVASYVAALIRNKKAKPKNYWKNTSHNGILLTFIERTDFDVRPGDAFLLCSDGFWEPLTEGEMLRLLSEQKSAKGWLNAMAQLAVKNSAGKNMDNFTAVAVRIN